MVFGYISSEKMIIKRIIQTTICWSMLSFSTLLAQADSSATVVQPAVDKTAQAAPQADSSATVVQPAVDKTAQGKAADTPAEKTMPADSTAQMAVVQDTTAKPDTAKTLQPQKNAGEAATGSQGIIDALKETQPKPQFTLTFGKIVWSFIVLLIALYAIRWVTSILEAVAERWPNLRLTIKRMIPGIRILSWTVVIFEIIVVILAPPIETIIAFTASAGIAIGFASQDILKNIFGGVMILLDRPFQVGDKIEASGHYGEVAQIGLRTVRIVTPDDNLVSIPNGDIMNQAVSNANAGEPNCQVVAEFYLPVDINIERTRDIAYLAAATSPYIFLNKPIAVIFKNEIHEGNSLLKMRLKAYVLDIRYEFPFMSNMTENVMQQLLSEKLVTPDQLHFIRSN